MLKIDIDPNSGFCFGVETAVKRIEDFLDKNSESKLYCLGSVMHNAEEVKRLERKGMVTIGHRDISNMPPSSIMIRAHGEPPETYKMIKEKGHRLIDATCPVVIGLQKIIKNTYIKNPDKQIVIFGKEGHAEVIGLQGQTNNTAIVISDIQAIEQTIDPRIHVFLFSQTTMPQDKFKEISSYMQRYCLSGITINDTVCKRVSNRENELREFSKQHDIILFISGRESSNGNLLYKVCLKENPNTHFVGSVNEVDKTWFTDGMTVGICGATSTPLWLMQKIKNTIQNFF